MCKSYEHFKEMFLHYEQDKDKFFVGHVGRWVDEHEKGLARDIVCAVFKIKMNGEEQSEPVAGWWHKIFITGISTIPTILL